MSPTKAKTKVAANKRRSVQPSAPEVQIGYKKAGRETLAAIERELHGPSLSATDAPVIEISETPAGRDTMAAIAEELAESTTRPRQNTLPYGDRISNAPGARAPSRGPNRAPRAVPAAPPSAAPPSPPSAASPSPPSAAPPLAVAARIEIFELLTFIIRGEAIGDLSTDALRRRFVEAHLLHRVPSRSMADVERVEITPWTAKSTMVVRIWIRG